MGVLVNLWSQVRRTLRLANGGTGNTEGWATGIIKIGWNRTGSAIALNTLVKLLETYNDTRVTPCTATTDKVLGVVVGYWDPDDPDTLIQAAAPDVSMVAVMTHGTARVLITGTVTRGQYAFPSATSGAASSSATLAAGAFGVFQSSGTTGNTALVLLTGTQGVGVGPVTAFATPAVVLGTAAAAGSATTAIRSDSTILAFDATVPAALGTAAAGAAAVAGRRDHVHPTTGLLITAPAASQMAQAQGAAVTPLSLRGHASQSAVLFEVEDSVGNDYFVIGADGLIATNRLLAASRTTTRYADAADANGVLDQFRVSDGAMGAQAIVASGDTIYQMRALASDGVGFIEAARIAAFVDGAPGVNDMPGRWLFYTTPDGSATVLERMRIDAAGMVEMKYGNKLTGIISPAQLTANTDNWNPTGIAGASVIRFSTDAARNITGIVAQASGVRLLLVNIGAFTATLVHDATSTAANRFLLRGSANLGMTPNSSVWLWYDTASSRWRNELT